MEPQIKHSGLGIASFTLSILSGALMFLAIIVAGVMETTTPGGIDEKSASAIVLGLFIILFGILSLIAFGLGIGGLRQKERKTIFALLGTIFSGCTVLGTIGLMILGTVG